MSNQKSFIDIITDCDCVSFINRYNPCLAPDYDYLYQQQLTKLLSQFKQNSNYDDEYFGEAYLLQYIDSKRSNEYVVMRRFKNRNKEVSQKYYNESMKRKLLNHPNIINLLQNGQKRAQGFIFTTFNVYEIYDYILVDLQRQFDNRVKQKRVYQQQQIILILKQCIQGLNYLQNNNIQHRSIRLKNIYISNNRQIKIGYQQLFLYETNFDIVKNNNIDKMHGVYLSPQQLEELSRGIHESSVSEKRSNIFSLGMCLLSLMHGSNLNSIYDYKKFTCNTSKLKLITKQVKSKYSERLLFLIKNMIDSQSNPQKLQSLITKLDSSNNNQLKITLLTKQQRNRFQDRNAYNNMTKPKKKTVKNYPNYLSKILVNNKIGNQNVITQNSPQKIQPNLIQSTYIKQDQQKIMNTQNNYLNHKTYIKNRQQFKLKNGEIYVGDWVNNKMHGYGWLYWQQNKIHFDGQFSQGKFHGYGIQYPKEFPRVEINHKDISIQGNWKKYLGHFNNGKREGSGTIYFLNGWWEGNFDDGQPNGFGIWHQIGENEFTITGQWQDGVLKVPKQN